MSDPLFEPIGIGQVQLKNRIFMPAMHLNMCKNNMITDQVVEFYRERAKGGVALISVGYATVDEFSGGPTNIGVYSDAFLPGLRRLADAMHEHGAKATVQLNHAGRYNSSLLLGGRQPVAPSAVPCRLTKETPRELELNEIGAIIRRFADAAARVREAGYDMVEVLAGTGYLISAFLSPLTNRRKDQYGVTLENRMRFGLEVVGAIRHKVGADYPIMVRMNGNDYMEGGIGPDELLEFAVALAGAGVDAICVNVGWHEAQVPQIVTKVPRGVFAYLARDIKARVQIPVIASHRINDPEIARFLIANEFCDMVAIGRGLIADPEFPNKVAAGRDREIIHCVACAQGCFDHLMVMKPVECLCNPRAGHEHEPLPSKTENPKKVLVAGGGAAGMAAAVAAAERGHQVLLAEQSMRLGGQLFLAGAPPGRGEFRILADDLVERVSHQQVTVQLNTRVTKEMVEREKPDVVIVACGGKPVTPPIPGVDQKHVVQAWDLLAGKATAGRNVVVIGGGSVGIETALMLAEEGTLSGEELKFLLVNSATKVEKLRDLATKGVKQIAVVEMTGTFGANFGKSTRWSMLQDLERTGIKTYPKAKVAEITGKTVRLEQDGRMFEIPADTVILAAGTRSENSLVADLKELGIACRVVGDASSPGTVFSANHQGYQAGIAID